LKNPEMNNELIAASKRGVKVYVIVSSVCAFGDPSKSDPNEITQWNQTYSAFDNAGINTRVFTKQMLIDGIGGYLHAKTIVVDQSRAWVGSVNGSTQALTSNREFGLFFNESDQVTKLSQDMSADFDSSNAETWQESAACAKD